MGDRAQQDGLRSVVAAWRSAAAAAALLLRVCPASARASQLTLPSRPRGACSVPDPRTLQIRPERITASAKARAPALRPRAALQDQVGRWALAAELQRGQRARLEAELPGRAAAVLQRGVLRAWAAASQEGGQERAAAERRAEAMRRCVPCSLCEPRPSCGRSLACSQERPAAPSLCAQSLGAHVWGTEPRPSCWRALTCPSRAAGWRRAHDVACLPPCTVADAGGCGGGGGAVRSWASQPALWSA